MPIDDELQRAFEAVAAPFAERLKAAAGPAEVDQVLGDLRAALESIADRPGGVLAGMERARYVELVDQRIEHLRVMLVTPPAHN